MGRDVFELLHPDDVGLAAEALVTSAEGDEGVKEPLVLRVRHADGRWRAVEIVANNLSDDPRVGGLLINVRDMTERLQARAAAERDRRRIEQVFDRAPIGMALVSNEGRFTRVNAALCEMLARGAAELLQMDLFDPAHPDDRARAIRHAVAVLEATTTDPIEARFIRPDGEVRWVKVTATVVREDGLPLHTIAHLEDVTEQRALRQQLVVAATHDALTGLLNRTGLANRFDDMVRTRSAGAMIVIDLDRFKQVNDTLGHGAGDLLLEQVADRLRQAVRPDDLVVRLGGDEFLVVLEGPVPEITAVDAAERIRGRLSQEFDLAGEAVRISGSLGVHLLGPHPIISDDLAAADASAYAAKRQGGDAVVVSAGQMTGYRG
jgi:diguanylate cyclase (GGDEF)-like protein/PAS domain S-box-containing protein